MEPRSYTSTKERYLLTYNLDMQMHQRIEASYALLNTVM